jgi:hypothetical protein
MTLCTIAAQDNRTEQMQSINKDSLQTPYITHKQHPQHTHSYQSLLSELMQRTAMSGSLGA